MGNENRATGDLTVLELNKRISNVISAAAFLRDVWVVGETSDLRVSGGHCYFELVEKADDGTNRSRIRATVWASRWRELCSAFFAMTGAQIVSGIKIRACVTASYHPAYGMSVNVTDIDASFTLGDAVRRRNEIIARLTAENIIGRNRALRWPIVAGRVAVISSRGAAGYGDFVTHLFSAPGRYRFHVELFEATMQGASTVPTVLAALDAVESAAQPFDCVIIIRGGGAATDLSSFDSYELARRVALFPIPVVVGIGHERDITVLDYVANVRVKTPTAAAEILIGRVKNLIEALERCAEKVRLAVTMRIGDERERLTHYGATIPGLVTAAVACRAARIDAARTGLSDAVRHALERQRLRLDAAERLAAVLSPAAVLKRGFSLTTMADGRVVRRASEIAPGTRLTTRLAEGTVTSRAE